MIKPQTTKEVKFMLPGPTVPAKLTPVCKANEVFKSTCEKLVEDTRNNLTEITVHMALLKLQEDFFSCLRFAPKACLKHMLSDKVICLMTTYQVTFMQLRDLRLQINPIRLKEEPPPPAQITQITHYGEFAIGQTVVDEDDDQ